jgi:phospholipase C
MIFLILISSLIYPGSVRASTAASALPVKHVILIMMENKADSNIVGSSSAPYENYLIKNYAFASNYYALSTSGLQDYIGITDGSTVITHFSTECAPTSCYTADTNIFSLLQSHGLSWKGYAESMPSSNCYKNAYGSLPNLYWPWHTAIPYYTDLASYCSQNDVPLGNVTLQTGAFFSALKSNSLPSFSMVSPNVCNDMHSCSISTGDKWLHAFVGDIISSSSFSSTVILITFDNGPTVSSTVPMIIVGPSNLVNHGTFSLKYTHYSTLATIEDIFSLGNLGRGDKTATPMSAIIPSA